MIVKLDTRFDAEINILVLIYDTIPLHITWLGIQFNLLKNLFLTSHQMKYILRGLKSTLSDKMHWIHILNVPLYVFIQFTCDE